MKSNHFWIIGVIVAFIAGGILIGRVEIASVLPFALALLCPIMMIFMMKDHHKH
jgi:hypothetical protein